MPQTYPKNTQHTRSQRWDRQTSTQKVDQFEQEFPNNISERTFTKLNQIPRSTFRYWNKCKRSLCDQNDAAAFFESPAGLAALHKIVLAATFVITQLSGGGIRQLCTFLELSELNTFVASSYGKQQSTVKLLEEFICQFGDKECARLAPTMPRRRVLLCLDETFFPEICLVALEPLTGYIIEERYVDSRDAKTWAEVVVPMLEKYNIELLMCVSDQAQALQNLVKEKLKVHLGPDLFHIQQDLVKATSLPLQNLLKHAEKELQDATQKNKDIIEQKRIYDANIEQRGVGRPPNFVNHITQAEQTEESARLALEQAVARQQQVRDARQAISHAYHPINLQTGEPITTEQLESILYQQFSIIEEVAQQTSLSDKCQKRIAKAKRLIPDMVKTLSFFWHLISCHFIHPRQSRLHITAMFGHLLPGFYLQKVAEQQKLAETKHELKERAAQVLQEWYSRDGPFAALNENTRTQLETHAREYAQWFVRASSCVEGQNAILGWYHRSHRGLSPRKMAARTVIHNYFIQRDDRTTAAQRFFGQKPQALFDYLVEQMPLPKRPAAQRPPNVV
jgi:hypothetical protein